MNKLRISIKELIIILIIALPISIYIYINKNNKISYLVQVKQGIALADNYCDNYQNYQIPLVKEEDLNFIFTKYKNKISRIDSNNKDAPKLYIRNDLKSYEISFKGDVGQEKDMQIEANGILTDLSLIEFQNFNIYYKSIKIHCKSKALNSFNILPMQSNNRADFINKTYKKSHIYFLTIIPILLIYILFITYKYLVFLKKGNLK